MGPTDARPGDAARLALAATVGDGWLAPGL
jgi:hypothetical protein